MPHTTKIQKLEIEGKLYDIVVPKNWSQSDSTAVDYIENRTHSVIPKANAKGTLAQIIVPAGTTPFSRLSLTFDPTLRVGDWVLLETEVDDSTAGSSASYKHYVSKIIQVGSQDHILEFDYEPGLKASLSILAPANGEGNPYLSASIYTITNGTVVNRDTKAFKYPIKISSVEISPLSAAYLPLDGESLGITSDGKVATLRQSELRYAGTLINTVEVTENDEQQYKYNVDSTGTELLRVFLNEYRKAVPTTLADITWFQDAHLMFHIAENGDKRIKARAQIFGPEQAADMEFPIAKDAEAGKVVPANTFTEVDSKYYITIDTSAIAIDNSSGTVYSSHMTTLDGLCFVAGQECSTGHITGDKDNKFEVQPGDLVVILNGEPTRLRSTTNIPLSAGSHYTSLCGGAIDTSTNIARGEYSFAFGKNVFAGRKGFYYSQIDSANRKIYLAKNQPICTETSIETSHCGGVTEEEAAELFNLVPFYISLVNDSKFEHYFEIVSVSQEAQTVVLTCAEGSNLPAMNIMNQDYIEIDDYSISIVDHPELGLCDLKTGGVAFNTSNKSVGNDSFVAGRNNLAYGDYSFASGRNNRAGHCSTAMGVNNDVKADYALAAGGDNIIDHYGDKSIVAGDNNYVNGFGNLVVGEDNSPIDDSDNTSRDAGVSGSKNIVAGSRNKITGDENLVVGGNNKVTIARNVVGGTYNTVNAQKNLVVGESNTVSNHFNVVGGKTNTVTAEANIVGGKTNTVAGAGNIVGGITHNITGNCNTISGEKLTISGSKNTVSGGNSTVTTDLNAVSGDGHTINGTANLVAGRSNTVKSRSNLIVGRSNEVNGTNSDGNGENIVGGFDNTVGGNKNIVSGEKNTVSGSNNIVDGETHNVSGNKNIVIGTKRNVSGTENIVSGYGSNTNNSVSGQANIVNGENQIVNGSKNIVGGGNNTLKVNSETNKTPDLNLVIGDGNTIDGTVRNIVGGTGNTVSNQKNIVGGSGNTISGTNNTVSGNINTVTNHNNLVGGNGNAVSGENNLVVGASQTVSGKDNIVSGEKTRTTSGSYNIANGSGAEIKGSYNIVNGVEQKTINGNKNIVGGSNNTVNSDENLVVGGSNIVNDARNIVGGQGNTVHRHSLVVGSNNTMSYTECVIVGGTNNKISGNNNIVAGWDHDIKGADNVISGSQHTLSATSSGNIVSGSSIGIVGRDNIASGWVKTLQGNCNLSGGTANVTYGNDSVVSGNTNQTYGNACFASGTKNIVGRKGYYYTHIDLVNKKIYLDNAQPTKPVIGTGEVITSFDTPLYTIDSLFTIVNDAKHENVAKIVSIENNVITYAGELPFTEIADATSGGKYMLEADDYSFSVITEPTVGSVTLKNAAAAVGASNIASGNECLVVGRQNNAYGDYSLAAGYGNKSGYSCIVGGYGNIVNANSSFATGKNNKVLKNLTSIIIGGQDNTINESANITTGVSNTNNASKSIVLGWNNNASGDCNLIGGASNTVTNGNNITFGKSNTNKGVNAIVAGQNNTIESDDGITVGNTNKIYNTETLTVGNKNTVYHKGSIVGGTGNKVGTTATYGINIINGQENTIEDGCSKSIVSGYKNTVKKGSSLVVGANNTSSVENGIVAGKWSAENSNALLVLGYGSSGKPSNVFEVLNTGSINIAGSANIAKDVTAQTFKIANADTSLDKNGLITPQVQTNALVVKDSANSTTLFGMTKENGIYTQLSLKVTDTNGKEYAGISPENGVYAKNLLISNGTDILKATDTEVLLKRLVKIQGKDINNHANFEVCPHSMYSRLKVSDEGVTTKANFTHSGRLYPNTPNTEKGSFTISEVNAINLEGDTTITASTGDSILKVTSEEITIKSTKISIGNDSHTVSLQGTVQIPDIAITATDGSLAANKNYVDSKIDGLLGSSNGEGNELNLTALDSRLSSVEAAAADAAATYTVESDNPYDVNRPALTPLDHGQLVPVQYLEPWLQTRIDEYLKAYIPMPQNENEILIAKYVDGVLRWTTAGQTQDTLTTEQVQEMVGFVDKIEIEE
jgi:hypothetical protein